VEGDDVNEDQWVCCSDPQAMLEFLTSRGQLTDRKARLFAVACCRRLEALMADETSRRAVELAEQFADGQAVEEDLWLAHRRLLALGGTAPESPALLTSVRRYDRPSVLLRYGIVDITRLDAEAERRVQRLCTSGLHFPADAADAVASRARAYNPLGEGPAQAALLRCLLGPLAFRPVSLAPTLLRWDAGTIERLARAVYEERFLPEGTLDPDRLEVLADALEEAGCRDEDVLGHCREQGLAHVRGCWVVDRLLNKG
jgi:hypothetical protein